MGNLKATPLFEKGGCFFIGVGRNFFPDKEFEKDVKLFRSRLV